MGRTVTYVGLDMHMDAVAVAVAEAGKREKSANTARSPTRRPL